MNGKVARTIRRHVARLVITGQVAVKRSAYKQFKREWKSMDHRTRGTVRRTLDRGEREQQRRYAEQVAAQLAKPTP